MTLLVTAFAIATALVIGLHIWALNRSAAEVEELGQLIVFEDQDLSSSAGESKKT